ncbi:hypothetical protein WS67_07210 [Burkholderia singularis]|uniref:DUF2894 domain-containing protein n=1 Tax=Burkholderia singularis TaxID=1503053 RepID=A0A118DQ22_9BURK|nr:DUF2894 domain-containing protein [Burkholderia singularis]KVE28912.1 hypothetical protein WS67_07210 [Burkholderia singularis]
MNSVGVRAQAMLDAWRECGADRLDPVRFRFIAALARRAANHSGEARRLLDEKLSEALSSYANAVERHAASIGGGTARTSPSAAAHPPARGELGRLIDDIAARHTTPDDDRDPAHHALHPRHAYPELEMLGAFRQIWSKLSTDRQLRQSLNQVPKNAGPLNSSSLVHRSLLSMRELSPGYLQQFLSYVDALAWVEHMTGDNAAAGNDAPRAANSKKQKNRSRER